MITVFAPAKINVFLRVLSKRPDGYHEIASLFQTIDLHDDIKIELLDLNEGRDYFTCSDSSLENRDNLCVKALELFREKHSLPFFVKAHLVKRIPTEAGLGGGSSDAAAMLKGLNELLNFPLDESELMQIAEKLGSDVPFFLIGGSAYCTGRGENVKKLKPLESENLWIVKPSIGLSTPNVYANVNLAHLQNRDPKVSLQEHIFAKGEYYNDLEEAAFIVAPSLKAIKQNLLDQGFMKVFLAGSGSSLIAMGKREITTPADCLTFRCRFN